MYKIVQKVIVNITQNIKIRTVNLLEYRIISLWSGVVEDPQVGGATHRLIHVSKMVRRPLVCVLQTRLV